MKVKIKKAVANLTVGKSYEVVLDKSIKVMVIDDKGKNCWVGMDFYDEEVVEKIKADIEIKKSKKKVEPEPEKVDDSDILAHVKEKLQTAATRMVDNIEDRREAGKYSDDARASLEKVFYDNMVKMIKGEIERK